ncbi:MAG: hypothetical protein RLY93_02345 [Sumerlaeia bacterium]
MTPTADELPEEQTPNPPGDASSPWPQRWQAAASALLLVLFCMSLSLVPIRADNDAWWHVKAGKVIAEQGLPTYDVFAYTAESYEWHNHEWLTQLIAWKIWQAGEGTTLGGWRAVILAKALVLCGAYLLVWYLAGRISRNWWIALFVAMLCCAIGRRTFFPRPPVVSNLLLAFEILMLVGVQQGWWRRRWLWVFVPLFALWTNLHGAWMAGAVILAAFCASDLAASLAERYRWAGMLHRIFRKPPSIGPPVFWLAFAPAIVLATFANPYGWHLYALPGRVLGNTDLVAQIGELKPPEFRFTIISHFTVFFLAGLVIWQVVSGIRRRDEERLPLSAEAVIAAFFAWQGLKHVRHLLLLSVAAAPLLARTSTLLWARFQACVPCRQGRVVIGALPILLVAYLALTNWFPWEFDPARLDNYPRRNVAFFQNRDGYVKSAFPSNIADFVELAQPKGRMFNENWFAGYLIWRLSPEEHKVFTDPRFDIFGADIWRVEQSILAGAPEWQEHLDEYGVTWIVTAVRQDSQTGEFTGLSARLRQSPDWERIGTFPVGRSAFSLWMRDSAEMQDSIDRARRIYSAQYGTPQP